MIGDLMNTQLAPARVIHPLDESALRSLKAIPGVDMVLQAMMRNFFERSVHVANMSNNVRLSEKQLPEVYGHLAPICQKLSIPTPEFFLEANPWPCASTTGDTQCCIVVTSGLLDLLNPDEIAAVIAHECGHIFHKHCLYHMIGDVLGSGMSFLANIPFMPDAINAALNTWSRMSELSADRIAALVSGTPKTMVSALFKLSGGVGWINSRYKINNDEILQQARDFHELTQQQTDLRAWESWSVVWRSHPLYVRRIQELLAWCDTPAFTNLCRDLGIHVCSSCGETLPPETPFCRHCGTPT